jgi:hypothetical protein
MALFSNVASPTRSHPREQPWMLCWEIQRAAEGRSLPVTACDRYVGSIR